jgi:hypothetical protein
MATGIRKCSYVITVTRKQIEVVQVSHVVSFRIAEEKLAHSKHRRTESGGVEWVGFRVVGFLGFRFFLKGFRVFRVIKGEASIV